MEQVLKRVAILALLLLTACAEPESTQSMRIGTNVWPGYEPLYLAREKGYLDSKKVQLLEYTSASQVMRAFRNDLLDAAAVTLDEAISLLESGEQLKIILVTDISDGGDALITHQDIKSLEDIRHKKIGVEHTALGAYFVSRFIEMNALDKSDITLVPIEVDKHERAFKDGEVDAVVTFDPVRSKLISAGGNVLFSSKQIPGEIVDVLVVKSNRAASFRSHIANLKQGWYMALDEIENNALESAEIIGKRMKLSAEEVLESYQGLKLPNEEQNNKLLLDNGDLIPVSKKLSQVMSDLKLIGSVVDTQPMFVHSQK